MRMNTCSTIAPLATFAIAPSASRSSFQESLRVSSRKWAWRLPGSREIKQSTRPDQEADVRGDGRAGDLQAREGADAVDEQPVEQDVDEVGGDVHIHGEARVATPRCAAQTHSERALTGSAAAMMRK